MLQLRGAALQFSALSDFLKKRLSNGRSVVMVEDVLCMHLNLGVRLETRATTSKTPNPDASEGLGPRKHRTTARWTSDVKVKRHKSQERG